MQHIEHRTRYPETNIEDKMAVILWFTLFSYPVIFFLTYSTEIMKAETGKPFGRDSDSLQLSHLWLMEQTKADYVFRGSLN
jgi:hypothetical protein